MWEPIFTNRFLKDVKRQKKRGKQRAKLEDIIRHISATGDAPELCRPHNLSGDWYGFRECHIEPDWLVIYKIEDTAVIYHRTGTHSDLFR